jgi:S1-C subfamily serine protease
MRCAAIFVLTAATTAALVLTQRKPSEVETCPLAWVDRPVDLARSGADAGTDAINDRAVIESLHRQAEKIMDAPGAQVTDGKTIAEQLKRAKADVPMPGDAALVESPADIYAKSKAGVLVLGGVYKCGKCAHWHVAPASGFIISADGLAVTNYHVLEDASRSGFIAMTGDGRVAMVKEVLAADKVADVAIVKLEGEGFTPLPVAADAPIGSGVRVISHPDGRFFTLTSGIVSRYTVTPNHGQPADRMCITADYAKGSSGGPVFDEKGRVVGLVSSTQSIYYNEENGRQRNLQMVVKLCVPSRSVLNLIGK